MKKQSVLTGNSRQYIRIRDVDLLKKIDKLLPDYKSFNQFANDALSLGVECLLKMDVSPDKDDKKQSDKPNPVKSDITDITEKTLQEIKRLMSEIIMNTAIQKAVVCSLFNATSKYLKGIPPRSDKFDDGAYRYTPDFLNETENELLKRLFTGE